MSVRKSIGLIIIITAALFLYFYYKNKAPVISIIYQKNTIHAQKNDLLNTNTKINCEKLKEEYLSLDELKKTKNLNFRFKNFHKKINNKIYRLRRFYKDGNEGEIETFLLYLEDENENAHIVEKSPYKPGPLYIQIEKQNGEILYTEDGVNLDSTFLHYINNRLVQLENNLQNISCSF